MPPLPALYLHVHMHQLAIGVMQRDNAVRCCSVMFWVLHGGAHADRLRIGVCGGVMQRLFLQ